MKKIKELFHAHFGGDPIIVRSPGRINIIGEHTDYNHGFVLPAAIDQYAYAAVAKNNVGLVRMYSVQFNERVEVRLDDVQKRFGHWSTYILGVAREMQIQELPIGGFDILIDGNLPFGAGLSSSAALECSVTKAIIELFHFALSDDDIIGIARSAEHNFAGVMCGIMDQTASVKGKKDHALLLDCRSREIQPIPINITGYQWVLFNSHVKHSLASSAYNTRRAECNEVVELINRNLPGVMSLRDVTMNMLMLYVHDAALFNRARFVIEENERVMRAVQYMRAGNVAGLGAQLYKSHEGLSELYEVSCTELDWLASAMRHYHAVAGARMMGGGFGGCTINLIRSEAVPEVIDRVSGDYEKTFGRTPDTYMVQTANGAEMISGVLIN